MMNIVWIGIGVMLFAAIAVLAIMLGKRPAADLGSVSAHWVADHRADTP